MANFFKPAIFNNLVASLTTLTFATAVICPPEVRAANANMDVGTINFGVKVEKIFEKVKKAIDKCSNSYHGWSHCKLMRPLFGIHSASGLPKRRLLVD